MSNYLPAVRFGLGVVFPQIAGHRAPIGQIVVFFQISAQIVCHLGGAGNVEVMGVTEIGFLTDACVRHMLEHIDIRTAMLIGVLLHSVKILEFLGGPERGEEHHLDALLVTGVDDVVQHGQ